MWGCQCGWCGSGGWCHEGGRRPGSAHSRRPNSPSCGLQGGAGTGAETGAAQRESAVPAQRLEAAAPSACTRRRWPLGRCLPQATRQPAQRTHRMKGEAASRRLTSPYRAEAMVASGVLPEQASRPQSSASLAGRRVGGGWACGWGGATRQQHARMLLAAGCVCLLDMRCSPVSTHTKAPITHTTAHLQISPVAIRRRVRRSTSIAACLKTPPLPPAPLPPPRYAALLAGDWASCSAGKMQRGAMTMTLDACIGERRSSAGGRPQLLCLQPTGDLLPSQASVGKMPLAQFASSPTSSCRLGKGAPPPPLPRLGPLRLRTGVAWRCQGGVGMASHGAGEAQA